MLRKFPCLANMLFDTVDPWGSTTRPCRGQSSSGVCQAAAGLVGMRADQLVGDGGDSPAWSRKRRPTSRRPRLKRRRGRCPYAELHCHSNFSFLDGASHPEELAEEAARLGLEALALTDHEASTAWCASPKRPRAVGLPTVFGAELTLGRLPQRPQTGAARPGGRAPGRAGRDPAGYARLAAAISRAQMAGEKGAPRSHLTELADARRALAGAHRLPQGRGARGARGRRAGGRRPARCDGWSTGSGATTWWSSCGITATRSTRPATTRWPSWPCAAASACVATNNVHYATPAAPPAGHRAGRGAGPAQPRRDRRLAAGAAPAPTCGPAPSRPGGSPATPAWSSGRPSWAGPARSTSPLVAPNLPPFPCPAGLDEMALSARSSPSRRRGTEPLRPAPTAARRADAQPGVAQIDHELEVIEQLGFPGYFLIVWDIVEFCRRADIFCQGRGSAAN